MDHRSLAAKVALGIGSMVDFDEKELCILHKGEHIIAMETTASGKLLFGCNKCVFERKL